MTIARSTIIRALGIAGVIGGLVAVYTTAVTLVSTATGATMTILSGKWLFVTLASAVVAHQAERIDQALPSIRDYAMFPEA